MAAFIAAAAGACSPACAAAIASGPLSIPFITIIGIATAAGYALTQTKPATTQNDEDESFCQDESAKDLEVTNGRGTTGFF